MGTVIACLDGAREKTLIRSSWNGRQELIDGPDVAGCLDGGAQLRKMKE